MNKKLNQYNQTVEQEVEPVQSTVEPEVKPVQSTVEPEVKPEVESASKNSEKNRHNNELKYITISKNVHNMEPRKKNLKKRKTIFTYI